MSVSLIVFLIFCLLILRPLVRIGWPVLKMIWRVRKAMKQAPAAAGPSFDPQPRPQQPATRPSRHDYIEFEEIK